MEKLILFFTALFQMALNTWFLATIEAKYKKDISKTIIFVILSAGIITILLPQVSIMGYSNRYLVYLLIVLSGKYLFNSKLRSIVFDLLFVFIIFYLVQTFRMIPLKILYPSLQGFKENVNNILNIFFMNINLLFFVMSCNIDKGVQDFFVKLKKYVKKSPIIILNFVFTILIIQIIWDLSPNIIWENLYLFVITVWILYFVNIVGLKYSIDLIEKDKELDTYKKYYSIIDEMFKEIRRKQHEFKNHLNVINSMITLEGEDNLDMINEYTKFVSSALEDAGFLINLKNRVIAALIYTKMIEAEDQKIYLEYFVDEMNEFPISDYELVEIIGNLLDNAFEAFKGEEKVKKHVVFMSGFVDGKCIVEVKNNGKPLQPKDIATVFSYGFSTKGDNRGFGLYNVKNIVNRNGGKIEVLLEKSYTAFRVIF